MRGSGRRGRGYGGRGHGGGHDTDTVSHHASPRHTNQALAHEGGRGGGGGGHGYGRGGHGRGRGQAQVQGGRGRTGSPRTVRSNNWRAGPTQTLQGTVVRIMYVHPC